MQRDTVFFSAVFAGSAFKRPSSASWLSCSSIVNQSAPAATVVPILIYSDVGKAIDWLCGAFGFAERLRAERDGIVGHAQLVVADAAIMLGRQRGSYLAPRRSAPVRARDCARRRPSLRAREAIWCTDRRVTARHTIRRAPVLCRRPRRAPLVLLPTCHGRAASAMGRDGGGEVTMATTRAAVAEPARGH
jgi:hypothetical protein